MLQTKRRLIFIASMKPLTELVCLSSYLSYDPSLQEIHSYYLEKQIVIDTQLLRPFSLFKMREKYFYLSINLLAPQV